MFQEIDAFLNTGDPEIMSWFLINTKFWPIFLCSLYVLVVKKVGPAYMKNREPYSLRKEMIVFNVGMVFVYALSLIMTMYYITKIESSSPFCENSDYIPGTALYKVASFAWLFYMLKYVEFIDTIFFVLRKKDHLITNLHVIHHFLLPLCSWIVARTDKSMFVAIPVFLNGVVHVIMYSYYALAAMGPGVRKYLWWKRYLTMIQMIQFIMVVLSYAFLMPYLGCSSAESTKYIAIALCILFFVLFYNYYTQTFQRKEKVINNEDGVTGNSKIKSN